MKNRTTGNLIAIVALAFAAPDARAAGIGSYVTTTGTPARWDNTRTMIYNLDQGRLGSLTHTRAARIVANAFDQLANIDTANLPFEEGDPLDRDVTGANLDEFFAGLPSDVNPVVFDQDGAVTDAYLGPGGARSVVAFGFPLQVTPTGRVAQGMIVINGRAADGLFDPDDLAEADLTRAIQRAILQMLNVGASDLNTELIFDGNVANNTAVPIMNPNRAVGGGIVPTLDDRMAVSSLYPSTSFEANTGILRGQVLLPDGKTGIQGINVIARKTDDPINAAVSVISGARFLNQTLRPMLHGSPDPSLMGQFEMHLPPGSYTVEIRPLRAAIGPRGIVPLPGGPQFYQTGTSPTAGPADASMATPVTVTSGQTTEIDIVAKGTPAPAPQAVTAAATPPLTAETAQPLPLAAVLTGTISAGDPGQIHIDAGGGVRDKVEQLYRITVLERSLLTLFLQPQEKVDLDLYLFNGIPGGALYATGSFTDGTEPEFLQLVIEPGHYYIGVTAWDGADQSNVNNPVPTAYTLTVTATPMPEPSPLPVPVLDRLVVGNVTATGADVSWITDRDATADALVAMPLQQVGDPSVGKTHRMTVTGLTAGTYSDVIAVSQVPGGDQSILPRLFFRTASPAPAAGPAQVNAAIIGQAMDTIGQGDTAQDTVLVEIGLQNSGGDASSVQITALTASQGWKLAQLVTDPISIGTIGSGATAVVMVRLLRDGTGTAPLATVTGTGTFSVAGGEVQSFTFGP
jgi:hypothetical protein